MFARSANNMSQAVAPFNPRPLLQSLYVVICRFHLSPFPLPVLPKLTRGRVDKEIVVRLKWGETEYKGRLISVDLYMNIQLSDTEEFIDGTSSGTLGQVLIRCNNVLWIGKADEVEPKVAKDTEMSG
jgi:small nuclear ribonucleoprotein F